MAKKLMRVPRSPIVVTFELLLPWIGMGMTAAVLNSVGFAEIEVYAGALAAALAVTVLIYLYENHRRRGRRTRPS